jgi:hypothetical protein
MGQINSPIDGDSVRSELLASIWPSLDQFQSPDEHTFVASDGMSRMGQIADIASRARSPRPAQAREVIPATCFAETFGLHHPVCKEKR